MFPHDFPHFLTIEEWGFLIRVSFEPEINTTPTIRKIPLIPPLPKGEIVIPLFGRRPIGPLTRREKRGEGRFSDQTAQHIRLASHHKRYLSE